jgi:hypothetical protein
MNRDEVWAPLGRFQKCLVLFVDEVAGPEPRCLRRDISNGVPSRSEGPEIGPPCSHPAPSDPAVATT